MFTDIRKELMHKVIGGYPPNVAVMHQLSHYRFCDGILRWLIASDITGFNLADWLKINHNNSILGMVQWIVKKHNKEKAFKPILYGRDWIK